MDVTELGRQPISKDSPSGKDVRYEPGFEALSGEVAKIGSVTAGSVVNWEKVISLSTQILEKESKHLQAAAYLSYALIKTKGISRLPDAVTLLNQLMQNFWDTLYPPQKRMKGRKAIIVWWEEKVSELIEQAEPVTWEKEKRDALFDDFKAMDAFLAEHMEDAPLLRPLINKCQKAIAEKKEEKPPDTGSSQASPETAAPKSATSAARGSSDSTPPSDLDPAGMFKQGMGLIGKAAAGLRKENPFDPLPYRLNRMVAWMPLKTIPVSTGGKTMVEPPNKQTLAAIEALYNSSNWEGLINTCESKIKQDVFWLDLSRYVSEGMEQLGHQDVCNVIESETASFVQRLTGIEKLCFSDGTPFADIATLEWLKQYREKISGGQSQKGTGSADVLNSMISEQVSAAAQLVKEKKTDEALTLLMGHLTTASSRREKFLWKIAVCSLLINAKKTIIASSFIDDLLSDIDTYKLDSWEPDNAVEALSLILTGLRLQKNPRHEPVIDNVVKMLSMLDPVTALKII